jgi:hypothetical protein
LSAAIDPNGMGIVGGSVTYYKAENGCYGVRIDDLVFSGEWCGDRNYKRCFYEIELWREGEPLGQGNWLSEVIERQTIERNVELKDSLCPSNSFIGNYETLIKSISGYSSMTAPSLKNIDTNLKVKYDGKYFIKIRFVHNDFATDFSRHAPVSLYCENPAIGYLRFIEFSSEAAAAAATCSKDGKGVICSSPDSCVGCNGECYKPGTYSEWICEDGKWNSRGVPQTIPSGRSKMEIDMGYAKMRMDMLKAKSKMEDLTHQGKSSS